MFHQPVCSGQSSGQPNNNRPGPRERIIEKALELFYEQGYKATGINQIIAEAGVAKASFYSHFKSKEALCEAYLNEMSDTILQALEKSMKEKDPVDRLRSYINNGETFMQSTSYRGCAFMNFIAEVPDAPESMHRIVVENRAKTIDILADTVREINEKRADDAKIDPELIAKVVLTVVFGAKTVSQTFRSVWPFEIAHEILDRFLE